MEEVDESLAVISSNGHIKWTPQVIMEASCTVDVKDFPKDEVTCKLKVFAMFMIDFTALQSRVIMC